MRRFLIASDQIGRPSPRLEGEEARHIRTVLRLRPDDEIIVFDGMGAQFLARIVEVGRDHVTVSLGQSLAVGEPESPTALIIAQGYLREKKMDHLVPPLTELGVARLIPMVTRRSVVVPDAQRTQTRQKRWEKIALQALKQCRRSRPMWIDPICSFSEVLQLSDACSLKLLLWEAERHTSLADLKPAAAPRDIVVMVGPEGGFEEAEVQAAVSHGFHCIGLGPRILRAETATLAVSALLQYLFGDMGQNLLDIPKPV
jgi:16S rRNA (uracil1498-N3)-methyltransferase